MTHKVLKNRARAAKRRQVASVLRLAALSEKPHLTEAENSSLPALRKAAHQAVQYGCRLARRTAKRMGQKHVPMLMRSSFKKTAQFMVVERTQGRDAAVAMLLSQLSTEG